MSPAYKRWYDHDPVLLEVINLLQDYQNELKAQAEIFLAEVEKKVSKEAIDEDCYDAICEDCFDIQ